MWKPYLHIASVGVLALGTLWGCGSGSDKTNAGPAVGFVITSDSTVGNLTTLTTTTPRTATKNVLGSTGLHADSVIRTFGGKVFVIQRLLSNSILVIDPDHPSVPVANYTTDDPGAGSPQSDPHDMEFVDTSKAYISRYALNTILIVNPLTGVQSGTIDLSSFAEGDSDGIVEMDQMVMTHGKLYVALQRVDRNNFFSASNDSYVVVIDTATDHIVDVDPNTPGDQPIVLAGRNPFGQFLYLPSTDRIYLSDVGNFFTGDTFGGIESINPNTNTTDGYVFADQTVGGPVGTFVLLSDTVGYATAFDANFNNFVVPFNLSTHQMGAPLTGIGTGFISGMAFDKNGILYVGDRDTTHPGLQVFDSTNNQKIEGPIDTGLPPNELVFVTP